MHIHFFVERSVPYKRFEIPKTAVPKFLEEFELKFRPEIKEQILSYSIVCGGLQPETDVYEIKSNNPFLLTQANVFVVMFAQSNGYEFKGE